MSKRRIYKKRRRGYHPYVKASAPAVGYVAMKAAKIVARKYLNTELKYYDIDNNTATGDSITQTGTVYHLNPISVNDTSYGRDGNQVKMKSIDINYLACLDGQATEDAAIAVFLAKATKGSGALPVYGDFFDLTVSSGAAVDANNRINALRKIDNSQNLTILQTHKFVLEVDGKNKRYGKFHQSLNAISRWKEDTSTGGITNAESNIYFLIFISDIGDTYPFIKFVSRVKYLDN